MESLRNMLQCIGASPRARTDAAYLILGGSSVGFSAQPGILLIIGTLWLVWEALQCLKNCTSGVLQCLRPIAILTMWVAPAISYVLTNSAEYTGYRLWIPAVDYFYFAGPGTAALLLGLQGAERLHKPAAATSPHKPRVFVCFLLAVGSSLQALAPPTADYLQYPVHLGSWLVWPGLLLAMRVWPAQRRMIALAGSIYALALALHSTYFGAASCWVLVLWLSAGQSKPMPLWRPLAFLFGIGVLILFLLSFKYTYREQKKPNTMDVGLFLNLASNQLRRPIQIFQPEALSRAISRFNQGFHTAQAMAYVPSRTPFVRGETLRHDLWGALVPRLLDPQKPRAGGKENLRRFAGLNQYRISANIGIYGEAYINFGAEGGWALLLAYGWILGLLWNLSNRFPGPHWRPYLFLPAVIVESDLGIVLNHICKSALVAATLTLLWHALTHFCRRAHLK